MTLTLADVAALTIDTSAARLQSGTITVASDGPGRVTLTSLPRGTVVLVDGHQVGVAGSSGVLRVNVGSGHTVIVLTAATAAAGRQFSCARPSGRLSGRSLGPVRLGLTRARTRRLFARSSTRGRRDMDFFCPVRRGIRVGYASSRTLLRSLSAAQRRRVSGRAVLVLTANRHYALHGVRPGTRLAEVRRRLHPGRPFHVGLNIWYLVGNGPTHGVLKVHSGVIEEIGIADLRLTRSRAAARRLFR